jgi:hypothetical protein
LVSFSFIAGVLFAIAGLILLLPWLRTIPGLASLPQLPWQAGIGAFVVISAALLLSRASLSTSSAEAAVGTSAPNVMPAPAGSTERQWGDVATAANQVAGTLGAPQAVKSGSGPGAESMDAAIAALQARLAKSGGTNDDWELLAKSYEFESRPDAAAKARAHQLPAGPAAVEPAVRSDGAAVVTGEVTVSSSLKAKAVKGATVFIIAKSVDSPGAPVAVIRSTVDTWPIKFSLDDSQSMLPDRKLSSAGRVTIEARISQTGQPLAGSGDLQGTSIAFDPHGHAPLTITIDKVIP